MAIRIKLLAAVFSGNRKAFGNADLGVIFPSEQAYGFLLFCCVPFSFYLAELCSNSHVLGVFELVNQLSKKKKVQEYSKISITDKDKSFIIAKLYIYRYAGTNAHVRYKEFDRSIKFTFDS